MASLRVVVRALVSFLFEGRLFERGNSAFSHGLSAVLTKLLEGHAYQGGQYLVATHVRTAQLPADLIGTAVHELLVVRWCPDIAVASLAVLKLRWEVVSRGCVHPNAQVARRQQPPIRRRTDE